MIEKVLVSRNYAESLIKMGIDSGKLEKFTDSESDGLFSKINQIQVSPKNQSALLEQLVLTPRVLCKNPYYGNFLKGSLIDDGNLSFISSNSDHHDYSIPQGVCPFPFIAGILKSKGILKSPEKCREEFMEMLALANKIDEYEQASGKTFPSGFEWISLEVSNQLDSSFSQSKYSRNEYLELKQWCSDLEKLSDLRAACFDYVDLHSSAITHEALLRIPEPVPTEIPISGIVDVPQEIVLLRIVADELGVFTHRPKLDDTLKLSREPATIALRSLLDEWLKKLQTFEKSEEDLKRIVKQMKVANDSLKRTTGVISKGNDWVTYIQVPYSVASLILDAHPSLGITISVVAAISIYANQKAKTTATDNWVMFNSK